MNCTNPICTRKHDHLVLIADDDLTPSGSAKQILAAQALQPTPDELGETPLFPEVHPA